MGSLTFKTCSLIRCEALNLSIHDHQSPFCSWRWPVTRKERVLSNIPYSCPINETLVMILQSSPFPIFLGISVKNSTRCSVRKEKLLECNKLFPPLFGGFLQNFHFFDKPVRTEIIIFYVLMSCLVMHYSVVVVVIVIAAFVVIALLLLLLLVLPLTLLLTCLLLLLW